MIQENDIIEDGTSKFKIVSKSMLHWFDIIYPVGSVYATTKKGKPFELGEWKSIGTNMTLWGVSQSETAGTTKVAGLPNITCNFPAYIYWDHKPNAGETKTSNSLLMRYVNESAPESKAGGGSDFYNTNMDINASRQSSIYGKSSTVQPPAYTVYFWHRIA